LRVREYRVALNVLAVVDKKLDNVLACFLEDAFSEEDVTEASLSNVTIRIKEGLSNEKSRQY
jgi:hypothetical protein